MSRTKTLLLWAITFATTIALPAWGAQLSCTADLTEQSAQLSDKQLQDKFSNAIQVLESKIVGQRSLIEALMIALVADGNIRVQGPTGVAKTRAIKFLSQLFQARFSRIQFTPDLMPGDITGFDVRNKDTGKIEFVPGPIFAEFVLADELNRASAKTQSALLEAMEEHQVTVNKTTHQLPAVFIVMATQNPGDQEGTYKLPEAQLDRFLLSVEVGYMSEDQNLSMLRLVRSEQGADQAVQTVADLELVRQARLAVRNVKTPENIDQLIVRIVQRTQDELGLKQQFHGSVARPAGPRAIIGIEKAARAHAWLYGRDEVTVDDVTAMAPSVLRHRISITEAAANAGVTPDSFIQAILNSLLGPKT